MPPTVADSQSKTQTAAARACRLPPFSTTAVRMLSLPGGDDSPLDEIERLFASDPALAAELLTAANSAEFGFRSRISTIRHALSLLGVDRIRELVMTIATAGYLRTKLPRDLVRPIWAHAVATAVIAEHLATSSASGALLYTAGLTHDLGRLAVYSNARDTYQKIMSAEFRTFEEAAETEKRLVGVTHTEAGGFLMKSWGFPPLLCSCATEHHDLTPASSHEVGIIQVACDLASTMGHPELHLSPEATRDPAAKPDEALREIVERRIAAFAGA